MLKKRWGTSMVEYVVLITLIVGLVGGAILLLIGDISHRLQSAANSIGT